MAPPLLPTAVGASYYQQPQPLVSFNRTVTQPLLPTTPDKKSLTKTLTNYNALPPWQWALGAGATCGLLTGTIGAWLAGKQYETTPSDGGVKIYYSLRPFNQTTYDFSQTAETEAEAKKLFQSQTYTHRRVKTGGLELISADFWSQQDKFNPFLRLDKLPTGQVGYRLGFPTEKGIEVDSMKHFAIYDDNGALKEFFLSDTQAPYFKVNWEGETFIGSVIDAKEGATDPIYIEALRGSIADELGVLEASWKNILTETASGEVKDYTTIAEQFLSVLNKCHVPLKLPTNERPPMPSGATLVQFPHHRVAGFAIGAIPVAVAVTLLVGLVQWCMPPTKKKTTTPPPTPYELNTLSNKA